MIVHIIFVLIFIITFWIHLFIVKHIYFYQLDSIQKKRKKWRWGIFIWRFLFTGIFLKQGLWFEKENFRKKGTVFLKPSIYKTKFSIFKENVDFLNKNVENPYLSSKCPYTRVYNSKDKPLYQISWNSVDCHWFFPTLINGKIKI